MADLRLSRTALGAPRSGIRDVFTRCDEVPDVISFAVGEPAATAPDHVARAGCRAIEAGLTHYTDVLGIPEFRAAAADYTRRVKGVGYDPEAEVQAIPGATLGLYLAIRALVDPGDEVIVPSPSFPSYAAQVGLAGGRPVFVPLRASMGLRLDADDIEAAVTPRTRALIVNSPGNPTGAVTPAAELARIADVCRRHDLVVVSDEVYHPFVYGAAAAGARGAIPSAPSIAAAPGMRGRTVVVDSLSKTFAMTGWRIGFLCAPAAIVEQTAKIAELIVSSNNGPAQYAGAAALSGPRDAIERMRSGYDANRALVLDALRECPAVDVTVPEGAFYAFVDVRPTGLSSADFAERLLDEEHVAVVPGEAFGEAGRGSVRISFAGDPADVERGMARFADFATRALEARAGAPASLD